MRDLPIAYGNSCYAKTWANKTTAWEDLCERLKNTIRTTETVQEYPKLKKDDRDRAKDKGGFVGGYLKGNRRKRETVACRSMLTMDADHAEIGFIDRFASECRYSSCLYTTHGHTPEQPRCRIIVPLTRDITPDEYVALARYFASDWGIDQFDECSYKPSQLMYWPTTPANGEFISKATEGEWLDPDAYLSAHPNWKDCSLLPTSSRESAVREASGKKQEDPLTKTGVIGAFCRAYGIAAVIETYLADVYEPSAMEGRYDYIPADSSAGVVVYDDKFVYSHHATDPACGKLLNAFDLVRIHRFGDDDEKKSFKQMTELALADDTVKEHLAAERIAQAGEDFSDDADWHKRLRFVPRSGALENSVWNLNLILENDPDLQGFAFNEMANRIQVTGELPWDRPEGNSFWRDADSAQLKSLVDIRYGEFTTRNYDVSFTKVADDRHFHPVRDYLNSLPKWDGVKRVEELFIKYLKADDTEYVRTVTRKTFEQGITGSITLNGMYGFRQNKGVVTVVEDEADLVRRIYKDFIDGYSYGEITDRLIADGVPTRMPGATWAKTTIQHIIRNEKYCGDCLFQKAFIANPITHQQVRNNGELPKYLVEDCLPAIVDKETWKLAQAVAARHTPHRQAPNERYPFTGILFCGVCGKPYYYYHYTTTNKQPLAAYRCMSRKTQSAVEVPGQTYTPPHKATFNRNASPELIAYRERYCKPPKERPMLCTDVRIPIDLPQKTFCRAWNLIVAKKLRYQATLRSTVDNAEDILVRYRAEEMCLLIDEIGKITEFSYPLMLKTLDRVVVNTNGKLTFIFQSGIKITV